MESNRLWIQSALSHRETDPVPYNFLFTPPARRRLEEYYGTQDLEEHLAFPIRMLFLRSTKPAFGAPAGMGGAVTDEFGVMWATSEVDRGVPIGPCLPEPTLSGYHFPDALSPHRFEGLAEWCERYLGHYTIIWVGDLWERATFMRGMEELCLDVALHPDFVQALLRGITDYLLETLEFMFPRFRFDGIALSDDYGTQKALLISPEHWRRFVKPCLAEVWESAKAAGRTVLHHSCGNVEPIVGDMVDLGLDILHPIQPEAMDILKLKREVGRHLTFAGGISTQDLLPRGRPEEVRREVRRLKREMGRGGGYILESGMRLQGDVPLSNLVTMMEEARGTG